MAQGVAGICRVNVINVDAFLLLFEGYVLVIRRVRRLGQALLAATGSPTASANLGLVWDGEEGARKHPEDHRPWAAIAAIAIKLAVGMISSVPGDRPSKAAADNRFGLPR